MTTVFGKNHLGIVDYIVVAATLLFSLFIGIYYAVRGRKKVNTAELLTGSGQMGVIPVAASMLVSYLSAITILGYPAEVYSYGSQIFLYYFIWPVSTVLAMVVFLEVMYDLKLTSAYKYFEGRYDSILVRWMGSFIFIIQLVMTSGIVLYAPAIALETMVGLPVWISVVGIAICGTVYTSIGGIKAVVWTDMFQFVMIFVGMTAIVAKALSSAGGLSATFKTAGKGGRLELLNWTIDPFMRHNALNIIIGDWLGGIFFITHQPVVQRFCSLPTIRDAVKSFVWSYVFSFFTVGIVIFTGITIYAAYADCDPLTSGQIAKSDQIVPYFVVKELAFIPGMLGLFAAVVFSAVLSTISSTLNSLAAVTWDDYLSKTPYFRNMGDAGQSFTYKFLTIMYASIIVVLAFHAHNLGSIVQAAITVVTTAISIQGAVFFMGVLMPFVNKIGAVAGMIVGVIFMTYLNIKAAIIQGKYKYQPKLDFSTEGCSNETWEQFGNSTVSGNSTLLPASELKFPDKLFSVSYTLYGVIGGVVTITVGVLVSLLTGGRQQAQFVKPEYLHRIVRPKKINEMMDENRYDVGGRAHFNMGYVVDPASYRADYRP